MVVPTRDEIAFVVYMNDEAMGHVVFTLTKKKPAKTILKDVKDLQRFVGFVSAPNGRKWVADDLAVISESKEVTGDLITDAVIDQMDETGREVGRGELWKLTHKKKDGNYINEEAREAHDIGSGAESPNDIGRSSDGSNNNPATNH